MSIPSRPKSAAEVMKDIKETLKHLSDAEGILNKKAFQVGRQIEWIKDHIDPDSLSEDALNLVHYLENKQEMLVDKISQTQSLANSLADYFNLH